VSVRAECMLGYYDGVNYKKTNMLDETQHHVYDKSISK